MLFPPPKSYLVVPKRVGIAIPAKGFGKRGELPQTIFCGSPVRAARAESPAENSPG